MQITKFAAPLMEHPVTLISTGENGAYLMNWVWISDYQAGLTDEPGYDNL